VGFANLLLTRDVAEEQRRQFLGIIADEGHRLTALINDFLDLQRMESGHTEIASAPVEIRPLLERAVSGADDATHVIRLDLPDDLPLVRADTAKLQQVLANLLSNACKYSPDAADVRVSAVAIDGQVRFSVGDKGLGVPPEALPQLFGKFFRVDNSDRRKIKGTGLGLAICKQIIAAHGGRIWAESEGLGKGTRILFTLPIATEAAVRGDVLIVENDVGFAQLVEAERRAEGLSASRVESAEEALKRIAAEEPNLRLLVSATLLSDECDVLEAKDGDEAWDLIVEHQPQIVILDLQMPGRTGLELAEAIRKTPEISGIRIIMLTSKAQRADVERGYRAGADVYLTKPFLPIELLNAVERAMEAA